MINNDDNNIVAGRAVRNITFTKLINISAYELAEILINLVKVMFGAPLPASCYNISKKKKKTFDFRSNRSYRKQWLVDYILNLHRDAKMKYNAESLEK